MPEDERTEPIDPSPEAPVLAGLDTVSPQLADAMRRRGFTDLTSVQRAVLDAAPDERDLRISSQTGSGKTVAIGLALARHLMAEDPATDSKRAGPSVLVLVPTRELAVQVREELRWLFAGARDFAVEVVMGGTSLGLERRALQRRPRVVVGTPGRTLDHLKAGALVATNVQHVVLDESDRMLDMGFREDLEAILECLPQERRTHLVSATFPAPVRRLADRYQTDALHIEGTRLGVANADIEHVAHVVDPRQRRAALVNLLLLNGDERCLIFVERRIDAASLAAALSSDGFPVQAFSGELAQGERTRTLNAFRAGTIKTLVSTDVAARGIDVPDIEMVIHADVPGDADTYVHRSGRTGRAGRAGRSVLLVPPRARGHMTRLLQRARIEAAWQPAPGPAKVRKRLRKLFRQQIHELLASDAEPTQPEIDYAKGLLDGRDPAAVVAQLLEFAQPVPAREPMKVGEPPEHAPLRARSAAPGYVRFSINWGERGGAAPNRVLGHVCRRGKISGRMVGAIEVGHDASSFDVEARAADRFEKAVRPPDPRDPKLRITRAGERSGERSGGHPKPRGGPGKKRFRPSPKRGSRD